MAAYVYGVVAPQVAFEASASGIEGAARPRLLAGDRATAIVADVPDEPVETTRANLVGHADVLAEAARQATVLPMRFGTVFPGDREVEEELLVERGAALEALLAEYAGKVEVTLRGSFEDPEAVLRDAVASDPEIGRLNAETRDLPADATHFARIRLGELVAHAVEARRSAEERRILARLEGLAEAVRRESELPERVVLNAAFLVGRDRLDEFDRAVDDVARDLAGTIRFSYAGPLALHSFAEATPRREAAWVS